MAIDAVESVGAVQEETDAETRKGYNPFLLSVWKRELPDIQSCILKPDESKMKKQLFFLVNW